MSSGPAPERNGLPAPGSSAERFRALIGELELTPLRKRFLESRWLDQVSWLSRKAASTQRSYYALRLTTVVGAVIVPALVSLTTLSGDPGRAARAAAWAVSLVVAISAAIEQFFHFGDQWRNYRDTLEHLKAEGWAYFQLSGRYGENGASHATSYTEFAERVETIIGKDVDAYVKRIAPGKERQQEQPPRLA